MIPIRDYLPTRRRPIITTSLILLSTLVYLWQLRRGEHGFVHLVYGLGLTPAVLRGDAELAPELVLVPAWLTPLTSMFLHGSLLHLAGNMLYLWIFGNNVEDRLGHGAFLLFYLAAGLAAAALHTALNPTSRIPLVGASGAISGVLAAYLVFFPTARVLVVFPIFLLLTLTVPASLMLGVWFLLQLLSALGEDGQGGGVAWWAHVGGFTTGLVLALVVRVRERTPAPSPRKRRPGPWDRL